MPVVAARTGSLALLAVIDIRTQLLLLLRRRHRRLRIALVAGAADRVDRSSVAHFGKINLVRIVEK